MLWFALHLSALPLEAWQADDAFEGAETTALPRPGGAVVVEARHVVCIDAAARQAGVVLGMSTSTAASLVAGLQIFERDAAREAALVQRMALALSRFTPSVVLQTDGVLLEVSASLRLFGGPRALGHAVKAAAIQCGVRTLTTSTAPTATAASVLARAEPHSVVLRRLPVSERLNALPLSAAARAWAIDLRLVELLHGVGCRTLGDVHALPRTGAQRRGAAALLDVIERAHGRSPDPQRWFELPRTFTQKLELAHRADDAAMLVFAAQRLVQPLAGWLAAQWLAAARLSLHLHHETSIRHTQPDTVVTLALADPTRDAAQITLLLRERLQRLLLPAPVYALTLTLDDAVSHAGRAAALWREAGGAGGEDAHALFDRLAARLGAECVCRPQLAADHRPERALRWVPTADADSLRTEPVGRAGARPTWLLPEPQPLPEDPTFGRPLHQGAPLVLASRAERIEAGWFDGQPVSRDYHVAQTRDHRWLWVYRERRGAQAQWFLHGVFG
jgi:protein ImuB